MRPALAALVLGAAAALVVLLGGPFPAAVVARGTEAAFARGGLHEREVAPRLGPLRWTTDRAVFAFTGVPGPAVLDVAVDGHRAPVAVVVDGAVVGSVAAGTTAARFDVASGTAATRVVDLRAAPFRAGDGRALGARLQSVAWTPASRRPGLDGFLLFLVPALALALAAAHAGWPLAGTVALTALGAAMQAALLWPSGLVHAPYARTLALLLVVAAVGAAVFARAVARRDAAAAPYAFAALWTALVVQGVLALSPVMVVSDVVFHAHKLEQVAAGDLFPVSVTQHAVPFRIPYGVSFYALLAPVFRGFALDPVLLVRVGCALAGILAAAVVFVTFREDRVRAAASVVLLQLLPGTFDVPYSYGNLSNGFAQSMTALFFCWWIGRGWGGWPLGAVLLVLAGLGHLSSLIVLAVLVVALVVARRGSLDRTHAVALAVGGVLVAAYYLRFVPLIAEQVPRLLEGGGQGRGASRGAFDAAWLQVLGALGQWGWPALILAFVGRPRRREAAPERDLAAFWMAGALLALPAIVSPLEVRYVFALGLPLALAAGQGLLALVAGPPGGRLAAGLLVAAQVLLAVRGIAEAVFERYR